ncbi:MAG: response regulator [Lachnospiraceae bacterium]|nr:response regulator [Lachnospiraceae bacterium]
MQLKILVTGRNKRIAMDVCEHLENDRKKCIIVKCAASKEALFKLVPAETPHVVIICLGDETWETVRVYDVLKDLTNIGRVTILVITSDEDKRLFMAHSHLNKMFFLSRPVSLFALYEKLNEIEEQLSKIKNLSSMMIEEYINPNADERHPRKKVLVVDDDVQQLYQIKEHLNEFYDVFLVNSATDAFRFLEKKKPDIIFLDYLMPDLDGPDVMRLLQEDIRFRDIPVVFLTGVTEKQLIIKTLSELKPKGYLVKPVKKTDLIVRIIDILG